MPAASSILPSYNPWLKDLQAGFLVFLLALPLSLGIAKASGFPAVMGLLSAMIGGLIALFFRVAPLSIKGPAAGLITICTGAITELGGEGKGLPIFAAVIFLAGLLQIGMAWLKWGKYSAFFPHTLIKGMLAAIGLMVVVRQIPVLLVNDPAHYSGLDFFSLILKLPSFVHQADSLVAAIGLTALGLMLVLPLQPWAWLRRLPAPLIVLSLGLTLAFALDFKRSKPDYVLVHIGDFWGSLTWQPDFSAMNQWVFWKQVLILALINSIESLLTVKAVDQLNPKPQQADSDADLMATGAGNSLAAMLGGLPIISEVLRSSANIRYGATSKWSNIFHGLFLFLAMVMAIPLLEWIPNAILAAMLIFVGYNLTAPKVFKQIVALGRDQLAVFLLTILVTVGSDLLLGIFAGLLLEFIFHVFRGVGWRNLFQANYIYSEEAGLHQIQVRGLAGFSNILSYKKCLAQIPQNAHLVWDFGAAKVVDHSFLDYLNYLKTCYGSQGGSLQIRGLEKLKALSPHPLATRLAP